MRKKNIVDMTHARKTYQTYHLTKCFENLAQKEKKSPLFRGSVVIFCYFFF